MNSRYGLECLFRFYSYGLEKHFRDEIYKDFQEETLGDNETGQLYGLEKFWAFIKYFKGASKLAIRDDLKAKLDKYKSIEDFRVEMVSLEEVIKTMGLLGTEAGFILFLNALIVNN